MEKSESIINLSKALLKFDAEIGIINKSSVNPFYKNAYAALPDILEEINSIDTSDDFQGFIFFNPYLSIVSFTPWAADLLT